MRFAFAVAFVFALLFAVPTLGGVQGVPAREVVAWDYTDTITTRSWIPVTNCTGGYANNASGGGCLAWDNVSKWTCGGPRTYWYSPTISTKTVNKRDVLNYSENFTLAGTFNLKDAGTKVLASVGAFNGNYCYQGRNITATERDNATLEIANIGLAVEKGKKGKYVASGYDSPWEFTGETERSWLGRSAEFRFGNHSIEVNYDSAAEWNTGVLNNTTTSGTTLILSSVAGAGNLTQFDNNAGVFQFDNTTNNVTFLSLPANQDYQVWDEGGAFPVGTSIGNVGNYSFDIYVNVSSGTPLMGVCYSGERRPTNCYDGVVPPETYRFEVDWAGGGVGTFYACRHTSSGLSCVAGDGGTLSLNTKYYVTLDINGANFRVRVWSNAGRATLVGTAIVSWAAADIMDKLALISTINTASGQTVTGSVANHTYNGTSLFGTTTYNLSGNWSSQVIDAGTDYNRIVNWTNTSTMTSGTAMEWRMRSSNTSFAQNDLTPAYTPLSNGTADGSANPLYNISRYFQFRTFLYPNSAQTNTPTLTSFTTQYSRLPQFTAAASGNVTFARPASPGVTQYVSVRIPYLDPSHPSQGGAARLALTNESSGVFFCNNQTFAQANTSSGAYCDFRWNSTTDGESPAMTGFLVNMDTANNSTNTSRPITTDNAAPLTGVDSISNTSTGSFTLNIGAVDNASGVNRSWYNVYNLSNSSDGSVAITGLSNVTWAANGTVSFCSTCTGEMRVSAQADDNLAAAVRFISTRVNRSFWYDPVPVISNVTLYLGATPFQQTRVRANVSESPDVSAVTEVYLWVHSQTRGTDTNYTMNLEAGNYEGGVWTATFILSDFFGDTEGTYSFQVRAKDQSTSDYGVGANATGNFGEGGAGGVGGPGVPGGGGGGGAAPISAYATPPPAVAAAVTAPGTGLACPADIRQAHVVLPQHRAESKWSFSCRTLSGYTVTDCEAVGERVGARGVLTGVRDFRWGCEAVSEDTIRLSYTIPVSQINDSAVLGLPTKELSWDTLARVKVRTGANQTTLDARLHVTNLAAPLSVPLPGPVQALVMLLAPFSAPSFIAAGVMVAGARLRNIGPFAWAWYIAAVVLVAFGLGSPQGGILGLWVEYSVAAGLAWVWVKAGTTRQLRALQRHYSP